MRKLSQCYLLLLFGLAFIFQGCYYDNGEDLYQFVTPKACDSLNISFSAVVNPVFENNCLNCHSGSTPSANINLEGHSNVLISVNNGRLLGAIRHESGFSPMPKGTNQLADCEIKEISAWIDQGAKNN